MEEKDLKKRNYRKRGQKNGIKQKSYQCNNVRKFLRNKRQLSQLIRVHHIHNTETHKAAKHLLSQALLFSKLLEDEQEEGIHQKLPEVRGKPQKRMSQHPGNTEPDTKKAEGLPRPEAQAGAGNACPAQRGLQRERKDF